MVQRVPGVTAKPVWAKGVIPFLRLEAGRFRPDLAVVLGYKYAVATDDQHLYENPPKRS